MATIWVLQHERVENLGIIEQVLLSYGLTPRYVRTFAGEGVPGKMRDAAALISMGGPMGVYEHVQHPFLLDEMRLMERALGEEKPVLGICLGSQLLAAVLGAEVRRGEHKEIGWHRVDLSPAGRADALFSELEPSFTAYHWHGDVFSVPPEAVSLAASEQTACQAFSRDGRAYGVLFHMEVTEKIVGDMVSSFADELQQQNLDGPEIIAQARQHLPELEHRGRAFFQAWAAMVASSTG